MTEVPDLGKPARMKKNPNIFSSLSRFRGCLSPFYMVEGGVDPSRLATLGVGQKHDEYEQVKNPGKSGHPPRPAVPACRAAACPQLQHSNYSDFWPFAYFTRGQDLPLHALWFLCGK